MNYSKMFYSNTISIIIVTYNSDKYIVDLLKSIFSFDYKFLIEIIIIDNNSQDDTINKLSIYGKKIKVVSNKFNHGYAKACNQGIKLALGKYIFLLNPDIQLLNNSLNIFFDFLEKKENGNVWCVGAQILDENRNPSKSFGKFPTIFDTFIDQFGIKELALKIPSIKRISNHKQINTNRQVQFVMGCNMFIRRSVLDKIGLFNEKFFLNFEEAELSWRAKKAGFESIVLPEAKILHYYKKSFTDLRSYLIHLWYGQLLFFKITRSKSSFLIAKAFHLCGAYLRFVSMREPLYYTQIKKILSV